LGSAATAERDAAATGECRDRLSRPRGKRVEWGIKWKNHVSPIL
jgi:hypothetical protein